jgi:hypothetical protein
VARGAWRDRAWDLRMRGPGGAGALRTGGFLASCLFVAGFTDFFKDAFLTRAFFCAGFAAFLGFFTLRAAMAIL